MVFKIGHIPWNKKTIGLMPIPWNKGKKHTELTKKRISLSKKGKHCSPQTEFKKGNIAYWKGKKFPDWYRKKLSEIHKKNPNRYWLGKERSEETKRKIGLVGLGRKHTEEWKKKLSVRQKGEKHWNWKGGISTEMDKARHNFEMGLWREAVFTRDNWTCQKYKFRGGKLTAHHIQNFSQFPELRTSIENGITLSEKAHIEFHKKYGKKNNTKEQIEEFLNLP